MRILFKYFLVFFTFGAVIIFYFFKTNFGQQNLGYFFENYLSRKTNNKIKIHSLNLEQYPYIIINLQLNDSANIRLKGEVSNDDINMSYHLLGKALHFNNFHLKDKVDIQGKLFGSFSSLHITGEGEVFEGFVEYSLVNMPYKIKDMIVHMKEVKSKKVFDFLEERAFISGVVNIDANFNYLSKYRKDGQIKIDMPRAFIPQIEEDTPFVLSSIIHLQGVEYRYRATINSDIGKVVFKNGYYHDGKKIADGDYTIYIKDLAYFEKILNHKYQGKLDINGKFIYDAFSNKVELRGETNQFGGELSYVYKNGHLDLILKELSLENILKQLSYPIFFISKIDGKIHFNIVEKRVLIDTNLKETRFIRSELSDMIYDKTSIDMLTEVYTQSSFRGGYQDSILYSTLKIDNGKNHIYLTDIKLNLLNSRLDSNFEIKLQGEEVFGEINGTLKEARVWIDKQKFIEYQTDKHLSDWLGTSK